MDVSEDWCVMWMIGMDFGVMLCVFECLDGDEDGGEVCASARARGRFFDSSGVAAYAVCCVVVYRCVDGVVYVFD